MSLSSFGKVPPYQDISHFRAPYKNAIFAGFGEVAQAHVATGPLWIVYYAHSDGSTWYKSSFDPAFRVLVHVGGVFTALKSLADRMAQTHQRDVTVYRSSGPQGPMGGAVYVAHGRSSIRHAAHGFGMTAGHAPAPTASPITMLVYSDASGKEWCWTSVSPHWTALVILSHETAYTAMQRYADNLAHQMQRAVIVHRTASPHGPVGGILYRAYGRGVASLLQPTTGPHGTHGLGDDPAACLPPKWAYNETTGQCHCAAGYVPTHDGTDCIPLIDPNAPQVPPSGGLDTGTWTLTDPITGATVDVPAGTPGSTPTATPTTPAPAACTGYKIGSTCVPKWALWVGGGLAAVLVLDMVL